jgi:polar amino acid transport system substrate-binding protein
VRPSGSSSPWRFAFGLGAAALVLVWVLVGTRERDRSLERVREGALRVGYAVEAPYAFVDADGEVTGESAQTARHVAQVLSVARVQWVQTGFSRLVPELETGRFDVVASGLFITRARASRIAFSRPTCRVGVGVLFRADQQAPAAECAALGPELRIAVVAGAVEAEALATCGRAQIVVVPDASAGRAAVLNGVVDALVLSLPTLRWMVSEQGDFRAAPFDLGRAPGYPAFAFRREDVALREAWDEALAGYLGTPEHTRSVELFGFGLEERADVTSPLEVLR